MLLFDVWFAGSELKYDTELTKKVWVLNIKIATNLNLSAGTVDIIFLRVTTVKCEWYCGCFWEFGYFDRNNEE